MIIEIESNWRETGAQCPNGCGMTYSDGAHPAQCPACLKKIVRHTHPEIQHPEARRLLAQQIHKTWTWNNSGLWRSAYMDGLVRMASVFDAYLRGVGRVF